MMPPFGNLRGKYYRAILVDAPTRFETWGGATAVAARGSKTKPKTTHYRTMTTAEIKALPVTALAADDCVLFLWCTWPTIKDSFAIIEFLELHLQDLRFLLDEGRPLSAVRAAAHGHGLLDPREHRTLPTGHTRQA